MERLLTDENAARGSLGAASPAVLLPGALSTGQPGACARRREAKIATGVVDPADRYTVGPGECTLGPGPQGGQPARHRRREQLTGHVVVAPVQLPPN